MNTEAQERERRREALVQFFQANKKGLKSMRAWSLASEVGYNTLNQFLLAKKEKNMRSDTYQKLADGASKLLERRVTVAELLNEKPATAIELTSEELEFIEILRGLEPAERRKELRGLRAKAREDDDTLGEGA